MVDDILDRPKIATRSRRIYAIVEFLGCYFYKSRA